MLRSTYNQNKHIFFFPGRLNFNEHVNSNHIKKFLWLEKKMYKHQCPCKKKKKVMNYLAIIIMIEWKWRLATKCRLPTWCFWLINANPSTLLVGHTRVIYSPCKCQHHIEPTIWSIPRFTYHLKHLNRVLNIPDFLLFCHFLFSNDPWS